MINCLECDVLTSSEPAVCDACKKENYIAKLETEREKAKDVIAVKTGLISMAQSGILGHHCPGIQVIEDAINTAVNISNLTDEQNIEEMAKHIAESLMNLGQTDTGATAQKKSADRGKTRKLC